MTVQYEGLGMYKLSFLNKDIILSKENIDEIKNFDFIRMKNFESFEDLEEKIEDLKWEIEDLKWEISKIVNEINNEELKNTDEISAKLGKLS